MPASGKPAKLISRTSALAGVVAGLRTRLAEAEETLRAIHGGEVDVVVVSATKGMQMFTLEGAEHVYRVLIESMNEGALTLTTNQTILYANQCFARMVKYPLEQVTGGSFLRFLAAADRAALRTRMNRTAKWGSEMQVLLQVGDGSLLPVKISVGEMTKDSSQLVSMGMVVTDMTEAHRTGEMLRALNHRVVHAQEAERSRVALELHDNITQLLCAVLFRSQTLVESLSASDGPARTEAIQLRDLLSQTGEEVERISRNLRPGVLEQLGLVAVLRSAGREFANRTGILVNLTYAELAERSPDTELALYRIFQEALKNVEQHAHARHVFVQLSQPAGAVQLIIKDDGHGFDAGHYPAKQKANRGLGLLGMRERAGYAGGVFTVKSTRRGGTEITVRIPLVSSRPQGTEPR